jgi:formate hydrogenlyase subunit 6/NADH:ubiquinone oxidoreductase subunit I
MGFLDLVLRPLARSRSTVRYPRSPADAVRTRRTPVFQPERCTDDRACAAICPTAAISIESTAPGARTWALDYGKCIFCAECIRVCPSDAIAGTGAFELDANSRDGMVARFALKEPARE